MKCSRRKEARESAVQSTCISSRTFLPLSAACQVHSAALRRRASGHVVGRPADARARPDTLARALAVGCAVGRRFGGRAVKRVARNLQFQCLRGHKPQQLLACFAHVRIRYCEAFLTGAIISTVDCKSYTDYRYTRMFPAIWELFCFLDTYGTQPVKYGTQLIKRCCSKKYTNMRPKSSFEL